MRPISHLLLQFETHLWSRVRCELKNPEKELDSFFSILAKRLRENLMQSLLANIPANETIALLFEIYELFCENLAASSTGPRRLPPGKPYA
ncbi:hypothetical protein Peur_048897 [Populus x canadensis]